MEIFPWFCLVVWLCKHNMTHRNIPTAATKSQKYSHDSAWLWWLVVCKQWMMRITQKHSHDCNKITEIFPQFAGWKNGLNTLFSKGELGMLILSLTLPSTAWRYSCVIDCAIVLLYTDTVRTWKTVGYPHQVVMVPWPWPPCAVIWSPQKADLVTTSITYGTIPSVLYGCQILNGYRNEANTVVAWRV